MPKHAETILYLYRCLVALSTVHNTCSGAFNIHKRATHRWTSCRQFQPDLSECSEMNKAGKHNEATARHVTTHLSLCDQGTTGFGIVSGASTWRNIVLLSATIAKSCNIPKAPEGPKEKQAADSGCHLCTQSPLPGPLRTWPLQSQKTAARTDTPQNHIRWTFLVQRHQNLKLLDRSPVISLIPLHSTWLRTPDGSCSPR